MAHTLPRTRSRLQLSSNSQPLCVEWRASPVLLLRLHQLSRGGQPPAVLYCMSLHITDRAGIGTVGDWLYSERRALVLLFRRDFQGLIERGLEARATCERRGCGHTKRTEA